MCGDWDYVHIGRHEVQMRVVVPHNIAPSLDDFFESHLAVFDFVRLLEVKNFVSPFFAQTFCQETKVREWAAVLHKAKYNDFDFSLK